MGRYPVRSVAGRLADSAALRSENQNTILVEPSGESEYTFMQMSFPVRFPEVYERVSPRRSDEEIERETNRRCGYPLCPEDISPVRFVDQVLDPRAGTKWERRNAAHAKSGREVAKGTRKKNKGQLKRPFARSQTA